MADTVTGTYAFTLPEVGASDDTWGTKLNANWSKINALFLDAFTGGSAATLGDLKDKNLSKTWTAENWLAMSYDGSKLIKWVTTDNPAINEAAIGVSGAHGTGQYAYFQRYKEDGSSVVARLSLKSDGAIQADVGYFKGNASGLTGIPDSALPANITATTVTATGLITGSLRHVNNGGYLQVGAYSSAYGSGYGRIWWNETANLFSFQPTSGGFADLKANDLWLTGGYPTIHFDDTDAGNFNMTAGNDYIRFYTADNNGVSATSLLRLGTDGMTLYEGNYSGNGSGLTSLPAGNLTGTVSASRLPTDSAAENWVGARIAGMAAQQLGTYCWLLSNGDIGSGDQVAGSTLRFPYLRVNTTNNNLVMSFSGSGPSGSWRAMQPVSTGSSERGFAQFLRYA